jgi:hypothetical protein
MFVDKPIACKAVYFAAWKQARVFATAIPFLPCLIFAGKAAAYQRLYFNGRLLTLPGNIRLW